MTPDRFAENVRQLCHKVKLEEKKILIGGDHLGPGAWCFENSDTAMAKAGELVRQCVFAGYRKLHLDPTMPCKDDILNKRPGLSMKTIADRTACLCKTAETAAAEYSGGKSPLTYVVGAEVPAPGGVLNSTYEIRISSANDVEQTIQCTGRITTPAMMNT
jgi:D-tagatose-1,6-bisphosphate aldolase subunit GatZ/KbaZ